jgi:hypothetical protein
LVERPNNPLLEYIQPKELGYSRISKETRLVIRPFLFLGWRISCIRIARLIKQVASWKVMCKRTCNDKKKNLETKIVHSLLNFLGVSLYCFKKL